MHRLAALAISALALPAQTALVVSHDTTPGCRFPTQIYTIDIGTGSLARLADFAAARYAPLAATFDPVRRELIVAVDAGANSILVRLAYQQSSASFERIIATVPGTITALGLLAGQDIAAITESPRGAAYKIARLGGTPRRVTTLSNPTAMVLYSGTDMALIAESRTATSSAQLIPFDFATGQPYAPIIKYPVFQPTITGLVDLPTGVPRQAFTTDLGRVFLSVGFSAPFEIALSPALSQDGTCAIHIDEYGNATVLGGSTHPLLKSFKLPYAPTPQQWIMLTAPFPGDPIDFFFLPPATATVQAYGQGCPGRTGRTPTLGTVATPSLANPAFGLSLSQAAPTQIALLTLGYTDLHAMGTPLPLTLPGSCVTLLHSADLSLALIIDSHGDASHPLPIPNNPILIGNTLFAQAFVLQAELSSTAALAIHIR